MTMVAPPDEYELPAAVPEVVLRFGQSTGRRHSARFHRVARAVLGSEHDGYAPHPEDPEARALYREADAAFSDRSDPAAAVEGLLQAIRLRPDYERAWVLLSYVLLHEQLDPARARQALVVLEALETEGEWTALALASFHTNIGTFYRILSELEPETRTAHLRRAAENYEAADSILPAGQNPLVIRAPWMVVLLHLDDSESHALRPELWASILECPNASEVLKSYFTRFPELAAWADSVGVPE